MTTKIATTGFNLRRTLLRIAFPVTQYIGKVHSPWSNRKLKSKHYHEVKAILRPGDAIVVQKSGELSNLFIPGFWGHVSMFCGFEGDMAYVIEAVGKGVVVTDLIDAIMSRDAVVVSRPRFATPEQSLAAAAWAKEQLGKEYDLFFNPKNDAFYCSELIWLAYQNTMGETPFTLRQTLGVNTVTPEDIVNATTKWEIVYDSRE